MSHALPLYRVESVLAIEGAACRQGLDAATLMQRAGAAAASCLRTHWPLARRIGVLCGPGNNGGDGYVAAAALASAGLEVWIRALGTPRTAEARAARAAGLAGAPNIAGNEAELPDCEVWIDALFGTGLDRPVEGDFARAIEALRRARERGAAVLALDLPSGLDPDRGSALGAVVKADRTLGFIAAKRGLLTATACEVVGGLEIETLGIPPQLLQDQPVAAWALLPAALRNVLPQRSADSHKGRHGRVLVVGGAAGMGGALVLAAEAAARSGAGWVEAAGSSQAMLALGVRCPEVLGSALRQIGPLAARLAQADVVLLGPGLGQSALASQALQAALDAGRPLVLDADALNLLARSPRRLPGAILTPHPGEAGRLLGLPTTAIQADRYAALDALVDRYRCVVVLKGAGTLVGAPGMLPRVIRAGNPAMASAGMGDVLAGVVAGLRAQGMEAFSAAWAGALAHAHAGDLAAGGRQRGLLASDLLGQLPLALDP